MADRLTKIIHVDEVPWTNGSERMTLPEGVRTKVFSEDLEAGRFDSLVNFPPGYVEPRHTHAGAHSTFLLEGRWIVEGKEITAGSYMYGPAGDDQPHGPFESPEGSLVFGTYVGANLAHDWDPDTQPPQGTAPDHSSRTRIVHVAELEWQDASKLMNLPDGVRMKVFDEDEAEGRLDCLIEFPAGYVVPRHTHKAAHTGVLLKGDWIAEGKRLTPGSYVYGPAGDQPHGPFESPDGTLVLISFSGGTGAALEHHWESHG